MTFTKIYTESTALAFKDASPVVAGYFTVSMVFGLMCVNQGLPLWLPAFMSFLVYAGAAQFAFLALFTGGASVLTIITTTFLINLRHMLMSVCMSEHFEKKGFDKKFKWLYGYGLTDESFAFHSIGIEQLKMNHEYLAAFNIWCHLFWILGSLTGTVIAVFASDFIRFDLSFALKAMMVFVLVSLIDSLEKLIIASISIAVMVMLLLFSDSYFNLFIATFVGCGVGVCLKKRLFS